MDYFSVTETKKPMKPRKATAKKPAAKKPAAKKPTAKKPRVPKLKLKPGEKKLDISLFQGRTSKAQAAFDKLKPTERLALIELEKLRRQVKAQREKRVAPTEEQKAKPPPLPLEEELALTIQRVENAIVPRQADIDRIAVLEQKLNPQLLLPIEGAPQAAEAEPAQAPPKAVTSLTDYKRTVAYKSLPRGQRDRLKGIVDSLRPADRRVFFAELTAKPVQGQITELRALLEPAQEEVPQIPRRRMLPPTPTGATESEQQFEPESMALSEPTVTPSTVNLAIPPDFFAEPAGAQGEEPVVGSGLKVSKPVIKRIVKRVVSKFDHPKDVAVILHTIRHPKLRVKMGSSGIEEHSKIVLDRFVKHFKPKFSEKKTLAKDLKKAFASEFSK